MVGGTIFHRWVIQREISRALVLNLSGEKSGARHCTGYFCLDRAFSLIEGHPPLNDADENQELLKGGPPAPVSPERQGRGRLGNLR
jgi:hypothetical protein